MTIMKILKNELLQNQNSKCLSKVSELELILDDIAKFDELVGFQCLSNENPSIKYIENTVVPGETETFNLFSNSLPYKLECSPTINMCYKTEEINCFKEIKAINFKKYIVDTILKFAKSRKISDSIRKKEDDFLWHINDIRIEMSKNLAELGYVGFPDLILYNSRNENIFSHDYFQTSFAFVQDENIPFNTFLISRTNLNNHYSGYFFGIDHINLDGNLMFKEFGHVPQFYLKVEIEN